MGSVSPLSCYGLSGRRAVSPSLSCRPHLPCPHPAGHVFPVLGPCLPILGPHLPCPGPHLPHPGAMSPSPGGSWGRVSRSCSPSLPVLGPRLPIPIVRATSPCPAGPCLPVLWAVSLSGVRLRPLCFLSCRLHLVNFVEPVGLNYSMFGPTLLNQGTTAQQEKWLHPSKGLQIIGTYAQTELGHGQSTCEGPWGTHPRASVNRCSWHWSFFLIAIV